ncbi:hypothetical protein DACRYDRAFT_24310 [Dacryopinax primogenitus]|uniref:Uncharacterized protein n=1 Tax=Dacryopinax primogenitus (strain DJM 731) TaxID=1858805 RepID=M5FYU9_DACPD|nr:uncharacterized protein DACRYDRAFT_24310 [Dacryopinax primogenitus]EJT98736.1 hypothetical protein DACRYDRAFT_24310 [Dacryopinax primogenitus]
MSSARVPRFVPTYAQSPALVTLSNSTLACRTTPLASAPQQPTSPRAVSSVSCRMPEFRNPSGVRRVMPQLPRFRRSYRHPQMQRLSVSHRMYRGPKYARIWRVDRKPPSALSSELRDLTHPGTQACGFENSCICAATQLTSGCQLCVLTQLGMHLAQLNSMCNSSSSTASGAGQSTSTTTTSGSGATMTPARGQTTSDGTNAMPVGLVEVVGMMLLGMIALLV